MGKVFNDQIIKILCAKNLKKLQNEIGEPSACTDCSGLQRGESYVVFLDKQHRKELQRQMGGMEQNLKEPALSAAVIPRKGDSADGFQTWINTHLNKQWSCSKHKSMKARVCESIHSLGKLLTAKSVKDFLAVRFSYSGDGKERLRDTPAVFGPFLDESICATADRIYYCACLIMGRELEPLEAANEQQIKLCLKS